MKGEWLMASSVMHSPHRKPLDTQGESVVGVFISLAYADLKNGPKVDEKKMPKDCRLASSYVQSTHESIASNRTFERQSQVAQ